MVSFQTQKFLILMKSDLSIFSFVAGALGVIVKKPQLNPGSQLMSMFSSASFMVLALMFQPYLF